MKVPFSTVNENDGLSAAEQRGLLGTAYFRRKWYHSFLASLCAIAELPKMA